MGSSETSQSERSLDKYLGDYSPKTPVRDIDVVYAEARTSRLMEVQDDGTELLIPGAVEALAEQLVGSLRKTAKSGQPVEKTILQNGNPFKGMIDAIRKITNPAAVENLPEGVQRVTVQNYVGGARNGAVLVSSPTGGKNMSLETGTPGKFKPGDTILVRLTDRTDAYQRRIAIPV